MADESEVASKPEERPKIKKKVSMEGCYDIGKTTFLRTLAAEASGIEHSTAQKTLKEAFIDSVEYFYAPVGETVSVLLWDKTGPDEYGRLDPLRYPQSDAVILAFSVADASSLELAMEKWIEEIWHHLKGMPIVLVGLQKDLRDGGDTSKQQNDTQPGEETSPAAIDDNETINTEPPPPRSQPRKRRHFVSTEQGQRAARKMEAVAYVECSSLTGENIEDALRVIVEAAFREPTEDGAWKRKEKQDERDRRRRRRRMKSRWRCVIL